MFSKSPVNVLSYFHDLKKIKIWKEKEDSWLAPVDRRCSSEMEASLGEFFSLFCHAVWHAGS